MVENMRKFLIYTKNEEKITVLGLIEREQFPSSLSNDKEYAKKQFGHENLEIREVTEKCCIKLN